MRDALGPARTEIAPETLPVVPKAALTGTLFVAGVSELVELGVAEEEVDEEDEEEEEEDG